MDCIDKHSWIFMETYVYGAAKHNFLYVNQSKNEPNCKSNKYTGTNTALDIILMIFLSMLFQLLL